LSGRGIHWMLCGVLIGTAFAIAACGSTRGPAEETSYAEQLAFLRRPDASRDKIEARLGPPSGTYQQGTVVSYPLYWEGENQLTTLPGAKNAYLTLMLHYAPDGHLIRYSLLRRPR